jgi:hypothetical protein
MSLITEEELKKIVGLSNSVPQEYRLKCFELLLEHSLIQVRLPALRQEKNEAVLRSLESRVTPQQKKLVLPIDVKAFLSQYGLMDSLLWKYYHAEGGEVRPIYQLKTHKKARAQIEHALMMSLESALTTGQFQVMPESLRARCQEQKCYDSANFMKNLKASSQLFKSINGDEPLTLSPDGKSELAELLENLKD